jgi:GTPase involved in cell partitioning and DNA repair
MDSADILVIVVDMRKHFEALLKLGLKAFLSEHLTETLKIDGRKLTNKQVIVSFNKRDLLDAKQLELFDAAIQREETVNSNLTVNLISCVDDEKIGNLLNDLKTTLKNL